MSGWIGVDLDGTLAHYEGWKGPEHVGDPISIMLDRVKAWLAEGREVRIFTARACVPDQVPHVEAWLERHGIGGLAVTNVKDFGMVELWDDRCVQGSHEHGASCRWKITAYQASQMRRWSMWSVRAITHRATTNIGIGSRADTLIFIANGKRALPRPSPRTWRGSMNQEVRRLSALTQPAHRQSHQEPGRS